MSASALVSHVMTMLPDSQHSQALWSGCGHIYKFTYQGDMLVAKVATVPAQLDHRHITQSEHSLHRKFRSYEKELMFYRDTAQSYASECALPEVKAVANHNQVFISVFTDFEAQGYHNISKADPSHVTQMMTWLARFHAIGLVSSPSRGTYGRGNYWHLSTRPDEYERMMSGLLKSSANQIDQRLLDCPYQTLIHGDAKLANFAFSRNQALGYDFQHIGEGIGVADVMLLLSSLYCGRDLELHAEQYLDVYFEQLSEALAEHWPKEQFLDLEKCWRHLWTFVWADFHRFLLGWKPDHEKLTSYMLHQTELCLEQLGEA
ncbi:kinase [Pseudoalteromonas rubra]|uniref:Kinase n=1 Tax=Pseudoalteromonas rubra TaxID=43658 RepID=A0A5S3WVM2_9GAMM|nr:phosphotransferase [Pseudoalteromonas rubra]TMP31763.1 kinase [Pseudoalteromonas rubra]TMP33154.1 kinase [Pseudoalteromonas rubra]